MSFLNPAPIPTWVFSPVTGQKTGLTLTNTSNNPVYYGGASVSQWNGQPLAPGNTVKLSVTQATYVVSQVNTIATAYTTNASALTAGSAVLTLSASATLTSTYYVLGASGQEVVSIVTPGTASSFTLATATQYDHKASVTVAAANLLPSQVTYSAG